MPTARVVSEALSNVDSAWLRMEDPTNLMTITALLTFERPIDYQCLKTEIEDRLLPFDRFRQRVVEPRLPFGKPRWQEDETFALRSHLKRMALPHPGDQGTLQETVSELMSTPLDYTKPLWQIHLIENYGDGCALIARIHHCIGDGIALVRVMLSLFDFSPNGRGHGLEDWLKTAGRPARRNGQTPLDSWLNPLRAFTIARNGASAASELGKLIALSTDRRTVFKGKLGVIKRAAWSDPVSLATVKAAGRREGATLNDLLLGAVTGALRRYMRERGDATDGLSIRAVVPVNLRAPEEGLTLGNRFGLVFLPLPVGVESRADRLAALKSEMDRLKRSPQAVVAFGVLNAMGMASAEIESIGVSVFARKATAVMTNVPGPQQPLYLCGERLQEIMFWVPQSGRLGLGVSILSYDGLVRLGIAADAGLVPDPGRIISLFHEEIAEL